jgi:hypothetical protein
MRYLLSLQALIFCLIGLLPTEVNGQVSKGNHNYREFQSKSYYFGLTFGYNHSNFQLLQSKKFILNDSFNIAEGLGGSGLNVSIVANMKLGEYFDFRFLPGFSFVGRKFFYVNAIDEIEQIRSIESVLVQMPLQLRFKSDPFHDMRMFVLAGAKYTYDVASNARIRQEQADRIIRISPHDFALEVGAGCQFFLPYFIFSPEIKYSQGIGNILIYNSNLSQSTVLEKVLSRTFTISLHFEG